MGNSVTCLMVDDDIDDQEIFVMAVNAVDSSISCIIANDGVAALELLNSDPMYVPDFIFLDVNMPRMNGLICLEALRKINRLDLSKIVMHSTTLDRRIEDKSKQLGANLFLIKPAGMDLMIAKLAEIFEGGNR